MRLGHTWLLLMLVFLLVTSIVYADIPINERVSLDGDLRVRGFFDERDFDRENTDAAYYATMRSMIGFKIQATDDVLFRVKIKDSRYMGVPYTSTVLGDDDATITNTTNSSYLTLQEGFIFVTDIFGTGTDLQLGRFEMEYGRGRILGAGSWSVEGPRTYDGFRWMWHEPGFQLDVFGSILRDYSFGTTWPAYRMPSGYDMGVYRFDPNLGYNDKKRFLAGIAASFVDGAIQPLLLVDYDSYDSGFDYVLSEYDPTVIPLPKEAELWITPAVYTQFTFSEDGGNRWEFEGDFAGQFGHSNDYGAYPGSFKITSFLAAMEIRMHGNDHTEPFVGIGLDVTGRGEGDDDPWDNYTFYQFYYTQHRFRGMMDYFWNVSNGLIDGFITAGARPIPWLELRADVHNFNYITSQGRLQANGKNRDLNLLGQEIDFLAGFQIKKGFYLDIGYCVFLPMEEFATRVNQTSALGTTRISEPFSHYAFLVFTAKF